MIYGGFLLLQLFPFHTSGFNKDLRVCIIFFSLEGGGEMNSSMSMVKDY